MRATCSVTSGRIASKSPWESKNLNGTPVIWPPARITSITSSVGVSMGTYPRDENKSRTAAPMRSRSTASCANTSRNPAGVTMSIRFASFPIDSIMPPTARAGEDRPPSYRFKGRRGPRRAMGAAACRAAQWRPRATTPHDGRLRTAAQLRRAANPALCARSRQASSPVPRARPRMHPTPILRARPRQASSPRPSRASAAGVQPLFFARSRC